MSRLPAGAPDPAVARPVAEVSATSISPALVPENSGWPGVAIGIHACALPRHLPIAITDAAEAVRSRSADPAISASGGGASGHCPAGGCKGSAADVKSERAISSKSRD